MRKKLLAILMSLFCLFFFCGCSEVNYGLSINADGSITQTFSIYLEESEILATGKTMTEVQSKIRETVGHVEQNFNYNFLANVSDPRIIAYVSQNKDESATIKMKDNICVITLNFKTAEAYTYYYSYSLDSEDDTEYSDKGYFVESSNTSNTVFNDIANNSVAKAWLEYFGEASGITLSDCTYSFTYSTPYEHLYSDADLVGYDANGNKAHMWIFTADDLTGDNALTGDQIRLYRVAIKSPLWYFTALGATAILIVALVIYSVVKGKKEKAKKAENINNVQINN